MREAWRVLWLWPPGLHLLAGLSGADKYAFEGIWGLAAVLELPDISVEGNDLFPEPLDVDLGAGIDIELIPSIGLGLPSVAWQYGHANGVKSSRIVDLPDWLGPNVSAPLADLAVYEVVTKVIRSSSEDTFGRSRYGRRHFLSAEWRGRFDGGASRSNTFSHADLNRGVVINLNQGVAWDGDSSSLESLASCLWRSPRTTTGDLTLTRFKRSLPITMSEDSN